jgi:coenzyme F420 hydrogenase subunit delta
MTEITDYLPEYCARPTLILGCGNILLGDDGFGPEVIAYLQAHHPIPDDVALVDAGTGVVDILFNIALSDVKPRRVILVDAMKKGQPTVTISMLPLESIQGRPTRTYSQHHIPTSGLLKELREICKIEITILTVEPGQIPQEIQPGLSPAVREAVPRACEIIIAKLFYNQENSMAQEFLNQSITSA